MRRFAFNRQSPFASWLCLLFLASTAANCPVEEDGKQEPQLVEYRTNLTPSRIQMVPGETATVTLNVIRKNPSSEASPEDFLPWGVQMTADIASVVVADPSASSTEVRVTLTEDLNQIGISKDVWGFAGGKRGVKTVSGVIDNSKVPPSWVKFTGAILVVDAVYDSDLLTEEDVLLHPNLAPRISVIGKYDFGSVKAFDIGSSKVTFDISNIGLQDLVVSSISLASSSDHFSLTSSAPLTIPRSTTRPFSALFTPDTVGSHSAEVQISSNDPKTPVAIVQLTGKGIE